MGVFRFVAAFLKVRKGGGGTRVENKGAIYKIGLEGNMRFVRPRT